MGNGKLDVLRKQKIMAVFIIMQSILIATKIPIDLKNILNKKRYKKKSKWNIKIKKKIKKRIKTQLKNNN